MQTLFHELWQFVLCKSLLLIQKSFLPALLHHDLDVGAKIREKICITTRHFYQFGWAVILIIIITVKTDGKPTQCSESL